MKQRGRRMQTGKYNDDPSDGFVKLTNGMRKVPIGIDRRRNREQAKEHERFALRPPKHEAKHDLDAEQQIKRMMRRRRGQLLHTR